MNQALIFMALLNGLKIVRFTFDLMKYNFSINRICTRRYIHRYSYIDTEWRVEYSISGKSR